MKKLLRFWLPVSLAFAAGWMVDIYWAGRAAPSAALAPRARAAGAYVNAAKITPFSANYANAIKGADTEPKRVEWSADSALGKILAANKGGQLTLALAGLIAQTPVDQLGALLNSAHACNDNVARDQLEEMAYAKWANADPAKAFAFAQAAVTKSFPTNDTALSEVLSTWAGHDPQAALAAAQGLDSSSLRQDAVRVVLANWALGDDPKAALDTAKALNLGSQLNNVLQGIYINWAEHDPAGAFAALDQVANVNTRNNLVGNILQAMSETDPNGALKLLLTLPPGAQNAPPYAINKIFSQLTMQDPAAAVQALGQLPGGQMRENAVTQVATAWADTDPQGAINWANSLGNAADRANALYNVVRSASAEDPAAAANDLKLIPNINQRNQAMNEVLDNWTDADPAAALKWAQNNTVGNAQNMALSEIVQHVAGTDPLGALGVIQQMPNTPQNNNLVFQTIGQWAATDPAAAMKWATNNLSGVDQTTATGIALRGLIQTDPAAGAEYVAAMDNNPQRNNLVTQVATSLAQTDVDGALAWINSTGNLTPAARNSAISSALSPLIQTDPMAAAAKLASLNLDPSPINNSILSNLSGQIANGLAQSDPNAAIAWSENLTGVARTNALMASIGTLANADPNAAWNTAINLPADDPARANMMNAVVNDWGRNDPATAATLINNLTTAQQIAAISTISSAWVQQDPAAASDWINGLPTGTGRDRAVQNLLGGAPGTYNAQTGMAWAATVSTPAAQLAAMTMVIQQTAAKDPVAAQAAVNAAANLTDEQKLQLTQQIQNASKLPAGKGGGYYGPPPQGYHYEYDGNNGQMLAPNNK